MRFLIAVISYNESEKLQLLVKQFPADYEKDVLIVDDGSTDGSTGFLENTDYRLLKHEQNRGVGAGIRTAIGYAREKGYDAIVIMAGNGKMSPSQIPQLIRPIEEDLADYVQGSRYLKGGESPNLPFYRHLGIQALTNIANLLLSYRGTDVTCGFRAYRLSILDNPEINLNQDWLDHYELEYYLHYKVLKNCYRVTEVPVSMSYPVDGKNYTKIPKITGWWSILRPWLYLSLGIKK